MCLYEGGYVGCVGIEINILELNEPAKLDRDIFP